MDKNLEQSLKQIIDEQLKKAEALENAKVKIAISGQSGLREIIDYKCYFWRKSI